MDDLTWWAEHQLDLAGYPEAGDPRQQQIRETVLATVSAFDRTFADDQLPEVREQVIALVIELLNRRALPLHNDVRRWVPAREYPPILGRRVMVRPDAFTGTQGAALNGREGLVHGARRGDFIIGLDDGNLPTTARLTADQLLSLVP